MRRVIAGIALLLALNTANADGLIQNAGMPPPVSDASRATTRQHSSQCNRPNHTTNNADNRCDLYTIHSLSSCDITSCRGRPP